MDAPSLDLMVYRADDGSREAWIFGPGSFSAFRDRLGVWTSPAPTVPAGMLADDYDRLDHTGAVALLGEARAALPEPSPSSRPPQPPMSEKEWGKAFVDGLNRATAEQPSPAELLASAKDYRARVITQQAIAAAKKAGGSGDKGK